MLGRYKVLVILFFVTLIRIYSVCSTYGCSGDAAGRGVGESAAKPDLLSSIRNSAGDHVRRYLPSPHSELLLGMLLGIDDLKKTPRFNDVLKLTGTIHVVVVSGY